MRGSDYDLVLVSDALAGVPWVDRVGAAQALWTLDVAVEPLGYAREELGAKRRAITSVAHAMKDAVVLVGAAAGGVVS